MDKETFKQKTLEVIEDMHQRYVEQAEKVIDQMDEGLIAKYKTPYFAPKAFYEALVRCNTEKVSTPSFSLQYVREYNKLIKRFLQEIIFKRF